MDLIPYGQSSWDLETYLASFKKSQEWEIVSNITGKIIFLLIHFSISNIFDGYLGWTSSLYILRNLENSTSGVWL